MAQLLRLHNTDDVAIALSPISAGEHIEFEDFSFTALDDIEKGHKIALKPISKDDRVIKYGAPIGFALEDIKQGAWVHTHSIKTTLHDELEYQYQPEFVSQAPAEPLPP